MVFGLILGIAIGYSIRPAKALFANYDWYRNMRKYSIKRSIKLSITDTWMQR